MFTIYRKGLGIGHKKSPPTRTPFKIYFSFNFPVSTYFNNIHLCKERGVVLEDGASAVPLVECNRRQLLVYVFKNIFI